MGVFGSYWNASQPSEADCCMEDSVVVAEPVAETCDLLVEVPCTELDVGTAEMVRNNCTDCSLQEHLSEFVESPVA